MSLLQDNEELKQLFGNRPGLQIYKKVEFSFITDTQSSGQVVMFDNITFQNALTTWHDAYVSVPLVCRRTTNLAPAYNYNHLTKNVSLKVSAAEIFNGINLQLANNQTVLNDEHGLPLINTYRKSNRFNRNGLAQKAIEFQYAPDNFPNLKSYYYGQGNNEMKLPLDGTLQNNPNKYRWIPVNSGATTITQTANTVTASAALFLNTMVGGYIIYADGTESVITGFTSTTVVTVADAKTVASSPCNINYLFGGDNLYYNEGFKKRIDYRKAVTKEGTPSLSDGNTGDTFTVYCEVPLNEVHDFFKQAVCPITNTRMQLRMSLCAPMNSNSRFNCILAENGSAPEFVSFVPGTARIYFKQITLMPQDAELFSSLIQKGIERIIPFTETRFQMFAEGNNSTSTVLTVSPSETGVQRIIIAGYPTGALMANDKTANPTVRFSNISLRINNNPERLLPMSTVEVAPTEHFQFLKDQTHYGGNSDTTNSVINIESWRKGHQYWYVWDFERMGIRPNRNVPIQIQVEFTRIVIAEAKIDLVALIEREAVVTINYDTNSASVKKEYA
jgi:hypothetical protein